MREVVKPCLAVCFTCAYIHCTQYTKNCADFSFGMGCLLNMAVSGKALDILRATAMLASNMNSSISLPGKEYSRIDVHTHTHTQSAWQHLLLSCCMYTSHPLGSPVSLLRLNFSLGYSEQKERERKGEGREVEGKCGV